MQTMAFVVRLGWDPGVQVRILGDAARNRSYSELHLLEEQSKISTGDTMIHNSPIETNKQLNQGSLRSDINFRDSQCRYIYITGDTFQS